jgi:eukaryotic-like serine/threonine-protein kinase
MGLVYLARDLRLTRLVALKFLPNDSFTEQDKQRFLHEARAAALIRHPNICPVYDIEECDGKLFIAMAYLEGETLADRIERGPLAPAEAAHIAAQVGWALDNAHAAGVIHRDVKSRNIVITPDGHASVLDFGLALLPGADRLTLTGHAVGTPMYMSPEQCLGQPVDARTDVWSLGVVLFEMLTAMLPFRREHPAAVAHAIVNDEPPAVDALRPEVPAHLARVAAKAIAKRREDRWQSAGDFARALREWDSKAQPPSPSPGLALGETMTLRDAPVSLSQPQPESKPRRRAGRMALVAAALAVITAGGMALYGPWRNPPAPLRETEPASSKLVAVLPFEVIGGGEGAVDIASGLTEILTAGLADFERIQGGIAAIPSSEIRRRNINSPSEALRIYGANWVVTGTAQPRGAKMQLSLQLIDPARTRQLAARVFEYDPANPGARGQAVDELAALLSFSRATARRAVEGSETTPPQAAAAYLKGRGLLARYDVAGNLDQAIDQLQRAVDLDPQYTLAHAALGEACWRKSRATGDAQLAARAIAHGERAVALDPALPTVHTSLAAIYTTTGREQDAIRELKEALRIAPTSAEAKRELARVYVALGRYAEAETAYKEAIAARPTDWYGYLLLGLLYHQQLERYEDAAASYRRAGELTPDNDLVHRNLGLVYYSQGRYALAVEGLQRSLRLKSNATTYASLGSAYYRQRRYAEAVTAVETAIDLEPRRYYFWGNLGIYARRAPGSEGKSAAAFAKAIELAQGFVKVSPNEYDARADLAEYYARTGRTPAALAEIARIPASARLARIHRIAIVNELAGRRADAISAIAGAVKNPATLRQIQDDPDLAALWSDPALQAVIGSKR